MFAREASHVHLISPIALALEAPFKAAPLGGSRTAFQVVAKF
jgi:hypothetical protein